MTFLKKSQNQLISLVSSTNYFQIKNFLYVYAVNKCNKRQVFTADAADEYYCSLIIKHRRKCKYVQEFLYKKSRFQIAFVKSLFSLKVFKLL